LRPGHSEIARPLIRIGLKKARYIIDIECYFTLKRHL